MVHRDAVHQRVWAARILSDVAANGTGFLAGRIGRKVQAQMCHTVRQYLVDYARLDDSAHVLRVDFQNAVHAREDDENTAFDRNGTSAQTGASAARHNRNTLRGGK